MTKKLSLYSLVMLIIASIDSIRNLPAAALFGSSLIFFFLLSAIVFLMPTSLVAAELTAMYPDKGGVYHWVHSAFGDKWAMVAIWMQWINTMVWYPTILSFIAGTAAYLISPELASNKMYLISVIIVVFWSVTFLNLFGIHFSVRVNNVCALIGTMTPLTLLVVLGAIWFFSGNPLQIQLTKESLLPSFSSSTSWISLVAIMASFLGMELAGVHVNDIKNPQKNFPKALLFSASFLLISMVLGSLAIAFVVPEGQINLVSGVMQVFSNFFQVFGLEFLIPVLTVLIVVGSIGGIINWLISPAKGLLHAAEFGFLPSFFIKKNRWGVPSRILIGQAVCVTLFCSIFLLVPSVNGFYWFLTALSTELYMIMYVLIFLSALCLHYKHVNRPQIFKIPGGSCGMWITCLLGIFACVSTIAVSFFPPGNINVGSSFKYVMMVVVANIITISPVFLFYLYQKRRKGARS
ncbi:MAG: APC family permease [Rhabdochlamydiaceae bacterium]|nr:APC family permease [Rhabdochlamydiaceae bacterium]